MSLSSIPSVVTTEPLALDLANTYLFVSEGWVDLLDDQANRTQWLTAEAERLGISAPEVAGFSDEDAAELRTVRDYARAAIEPARHAKKPPPPALSGLTEALCAAPAIPRARWDGSAVTATPHRDGPLVIRVAATLAEAVIELLADPAIYRVRRCDAPTCEILFLPRNPNRRWCTPSICGNRARVARYYLRHKPDQADTAL